MDVHLRDIRYFVTAAEYLHFTRAAEALFVSQPALSKQIGLLERQLRTQLFQRDRRGVSLTPAGEALLSQARKLLAAWDESQQLIAAAAHQQEATLLIGISTGLGRGLLPGVRAKLADFAPQARLQVRQVPWDDPTAGLLSQGSARTDAAFVWLPLPSSRKLEWIDVATEARLVALPEHHPLAARERIDIGDLLDEPFLALPASSGPLREFWLATDAREGHPIRIGAEISSTEETVEALTAELGVCLLAAGNASLVTRDGVVARPVAGVEHARLVFAWRRGDDRPLLRALREAVRSFAASVEKA
jgi:DNA-binding transcriptional LysR family regulator